MKLLLGGGGRKPISPEVPLAALAEEHHTSIQYAAVRKDTSVSCRKRMHLETTILSEVRHISLKVA